MQLRNASEKHKKASVGTGRRCTPGGLAREFLRAGMNNQRQHGYDAVDLGALDHDGRYRLLTGSVVPRPIALVTSIGSNGVLNAAPFSQFIIITYDPPMLGFVVHQGPNGLKDTLNNVRDSREFVINIVSESMAVQVQRCAEPFPPSVSEPAEVGFLTIPSLTIRPARIADSLVQFECRLQSTVDFGDPVATLVVGEISVAHLSRTVVDGRRINHAALDPLGRIAGRSYCRTREVVHV
jgi:flavin reductase (DIM6/NTAB) family NADH-FMN oxidoreductase RutF